MSAETIPYEAIDCEIRALVRLINAIPGLRTWSSCAGHDDTSTAPTFVAFTITGPEALHSLLEAIEAAALSGGVQNNCPYAQYADITVHLDAAQRVYYSLVIAGYPRYMQRRAVEQIERAIASRVQLSSK
jgi:hypothetical protein